MGSYSSISRQTMKKMDARAADLIATAPKLKNIIDAVYEISEDEKQIDDILRRVCTSSLKEEKYDLRTMHRINGYDANWVFEQPRKTGNMILDLLGPHLAKTIPGAPLWPRQSSIFESYLQYRNYELVEKKRLSAEGKEKPIKYKEWNMMIYMKKMSERLTGLYPEFKSFFDSIITAPYLIKEYSPSYAYFSRLENCVQIVQLRDQPEELSKFVGGHIINEAKWYMDYLTNISRVSAWHPKVSIEKITSLSILLKAVSRDNFPYLYSTIQETLSKNATIKEPGEVPIRVSHVPSAPLINDVKPGTIHPPGGISFSP